MQLIRINSMPAEVVDKETNAPYIMLDYLHPCIFGDASPVDQNVAYLPLNWMFLPCS